MAQWHILARFSLLAEQFVDLAKCKLILKCYALKCMTLRMVIDSSAAVR